jgi:hypothetical protein
MEKKSMMNINEIMEQNPFQKRAIPKSLTIRKGKMLIDKYINNGYIEL